MLKVFLIIFFSSFVLNASQILLVVSDDFNTSKAKLSAYENGKIIFSDIDVNLGRNGLGWGLGFQEIPHIKNEPVKHEGDGKAPAGIFQLGTAFGYQKSLDLKLPYLYADEHLICVDDVTSNNYNHFVSSKSGIKSFEYMRREDQQYKYGLVVLHNQKQKVPNGSCIFMHIEKSEDHPTAGCTSMKEKDLLKILKWLDKKEEPILIQVPKKYLDKVLRLYPELKRN